MRIVVSGDYKRAPDPTCLPFEVVPCDVFITEATFGLPVFRHPDARGEVAQAARLRARCFPERAHIVGAYALGKAQRVMALMREAGYDEPIYIHGAHGAPDRVLQARGHRPRRRPPKVAAAERGEARRRHRALPALRDPGPVVAPLPRPVTAFASGWMRVRARARQKGVELPLVISDHSDWDDLCRTILETGAGEVWVTHGQEDALVHWCATQRHPGQAAAHAGLRRRGRGRSRGAGRTHAGAEAPPEPLRRPARPPRLRAAPQRQAAAAGGLFPHTPDPERGWALAAMTGGAQLRATPSRA